MAVSIGAIEGTIRLKDEWTTTLDRAVSKFVESSTKIKQSGKSVEDQTDRLAKAYKQLAASLDPASRGQQKYAQVQATLDRLVKSGVISQADYNRQLAMARSRYLEASNAAAVMNRQVSNTALMVKGAIVAFASFQAARAVRATLSQFVEANKEAEESMHRLEAASERAGSALPIDELLDMADAASRLTGIDDELIADAEAILLRYNRIGRDIFPKVTQAALDLSAATGTDLSAAMEKVGKMVNNPLRALTLLNREGYAVGASQSKLVKDMLKTNDVAGAQGVILDILVKQYGNASVEARDTFGGAITALGTTWENFLERIGQDHMGPLRSGIESLITLLEAATDNWTKFELGANTATANVNRAILRVIDSMLALVEAGTKVQQALAFDGTPADTAAKNMQKTIAGLRSNVGASFGKVISDADQAAAKAMIKLLVSEGKFSEELARKLGILGAAHKKGAGAALEQTEQEDRLGKGFDVLADRAATLAKELAGLADEQILNARHSREMLSAVLSGVPGATGALASKHALEIAYLKDLEKFGKSAAGGLQKLRLEAAGAKAELSAFEELERLNDKFIQDASDRIKDQVRTGAEEMEDFTRQVFDASFVNWEVFNDKVKAAIQARADERIALESEIWESTASGFERAIAAAKGWQADLARRIDDAVDRGVLSAKRGHELILQSREALARREAEILTDEVGAALDSLGRFISLLDKKLGSLVGSIGGALGASSAFSKDQSWATLFGAAGAWWTAFVELANFINASGKKGMQWFTSVGQTGGSVGVTGAGTNVSATNLGKYQELSRQANELGTAISKAINDLLSMMGASLHTFASFDIREEGGFVVVQFENQFKQWFLNIEEAMAFAITRALQESDISGMDDAIKTALHNVNAKSLEELQEKLQFAFDFSRLGVNEAALSLRDLANESSAAAKQAFELGLSVQKIGEEFARSAGSLRDEITGVITDPYQRDLKRMEAFNAEIVRLTDQYTRLLSLHDVEIAQIKESIALTIAQIKAEGALAEAERLALVADQERLKFLLGEIASLQSLLANLPKPIDVSEIVRRGTGGGGADAREGVREFIDTRAFELSLRTLSDYQRAIAEIGRQYEEQLKQAGKDIVLRGQLIDLKERELALLAKEQKEDIAARFTDFLGLVTPFDQVRDTAAALIKDIQDSPFGDARKARMIGRVFEDIERQIQRLSDEMTVSLLGSLIGDLEKHGASEQVQLQARQAMAIIEHTLKMEHYRTEIAILKAQGKLSEATIAILDGALAFLGSIDPTAVIPGGSTGETPRFRDWWSDTGEAAQALADKFKQAGDLLAKYQKQAIDPLIEDLLELESDFVLIRESFGDTLEVQAAYANGLRTIMQRAFGVITNLLDSLDTSDLSPLRTIDKFKAAQSNFFDSVADILSGDFSQLGDIQSLFEEALQLAGEVSPMGSQGYKKVFDDMKAALLQLASMADLPPGVLKSLSSGISLGNLILPDPNVFSQAQVQAQTMPVVDSIGKHSDRQIVEIRAIRESNERSEVDIHKMHQLAIVASMSGSK